MIDEKKLIEEVSQWYWDKGLQEVDEEWADLWIDMFIRTIKKQPKVGEWIPVSERLPKEHERVLVWYEYFRYGGYNRMYQTYGIGHHIKDGFWSGDVCGEKARCIAWMPLPQKYEG